MTDVFFDKDYLSHYKQIIINKSGLEIPFSIIEYNDLRSFVSIGYQGCITTNSSNDTSNFLSEIMNTALKNNIITIFIRYNPMLENHQLFKNIIPVELTSSCFIIDTKKIFEDYLNKRPSRLLNIIKNKHKPNIRTNNNIEKSIIKNALIYNNEYISDIADIKQLINNDLAVLVQAFDNDEEIAASLFIRNNTSAVYALNYSSEKGKSRYANIFILMHFIEYAFNSNINIVYLGAGISSNDSLALFKKQFATNISDVYHSKLIINKLLYDKYNKGSNYFPSWLKNKSIPSLIQAMPLQ